MQFTVRVRILLFVLFWSQPGLVPTGLASTRACDALRQIFEGERLTIDGLVSRIKAYRARNVKRGRVRELTVKGIQYTAEGILGESSNIVYLAKSPDGKSVAIKKPLKEMEDPE